MGLTETIRKHRRIMIDTAPVIYFIEEHSVYGSIADKLFLRIKQNRDIRMFSSFITLIEVLTVPLRESDSALAEKYKNFLLNSDNFTVYNLDPPVGEQAAMLRAKYGLRTPDAIQSATGTENYATLFVTNDSRLKKIQEIEILVLADYLEE